MGVYLNIRMEQLLPTSGEESVETLRGEPLKDQCGRLGRDLRSHHPSRWDLTWVLHKEKGGLHSPRYVVVLQRTATRFFMSTVDSFIPICVTSVSREPEKMTGSVTTQPGGRGPTPHKQSGQVFLMNTTTAVHHTDSTRLIWPFFTIFF